MNQEDYENYISIHAPRVGSDLELKTVSNVNGVFQSTLPVWGATFRGNRYIGMACDFNPRSPCGERPRRVRLQVS